MYSFIDLIVGSAYLLVCLFRSGSFVVSSFKLGQGHVLLVDLVGLALLVLAVLLALLVAVPGAQII